MEERVVTELCKLNKFKLTDPNGMRSAVARSITELLAVCRVPLQCLPHGMDMAQRMENYYSSGDVQE